MGEILRAVLDESCTYSQPAFYTMTLPLSANNSGSHVTLNTVLQLKQDRYFSQTGAFLVTQFASGGIPAEPGYAGGSYTGNEFVDMYDAQSGHHYFSGPLAFINKGLVNFMPAAILNDNVSNMLTFPEYILWEPAQTVGVNVRGYGIAPSLGQMQYTFMLVGIEYAK